MYLPPQGRDFYFGRRKKRRFFRGGFGFLVFKKDVFWRAASPRNDTQAPVARANASKAQIKVSESLEPPIKTFPTIIGDSFVVLLIN